MWSKQNVCIVHLHSMIQFGFSFLCDSNRGQWKLGYILSLDFLA